MQLDQGSNLKKPACASKQEVLEKVPHWTISHSCIRTPWLFHSFLYFCLIFNIFFQNRPRTVKPLKPVCWAEQKRKATQFYIHSYIHTIHNTYYVVHILLHRYLPKVFTIKTKPSIESVQNLNFRLGIENKVHLWPLHCWKLKSQFFWYTVAEGVSSTMTKVEIAKDIHLQKWRVFVIWCEKHFDILVGQIQSKLINRLVTYILTGP